MRHLLVIQIKYWEFLSRIIYKNNVKKRLQFFLFRLFIYQFCWLVVVVVVLYFYFLCLVNLAFGQLKLAIILHHISFNNLFVFMVFIVHMYYVNARESFKDQRKYKNKIASALADEINNILVSFLLILKNAKVKRYLQFGFVCLLF